MDRTVRVMRPLITRAAVAVDRLDDCRALMLVDPDLGFVAHRLSFLSLSRTRLSAGRGEVAALGRGM